jgi:hypothetical protein
MNKKEEELINQVRLNPHSPRQLVVDCLKAIVEDAKKLPLSELTKTRSQQSPTDTTGEAIAIKIAHIIISQDWIDYETADDLCEVEELATSLELDAKHQNVWKELFEKIRNLEP